MTIIIPTAIFIDFYEEYDRIISSKHFWLVKNCFTYFHLKFSI